MRQFFRFGIVGTLGFMIDAGILLLLTKILHFDPILARFFSFFPANAATWYCNRHFTFSPHPTKKAIHEWLHYLALTSIGTLINFLIYTFLVLINGRWFTLHLLLILAIAALVAMLFNFLSSKYLAFSSSIRFTKKNF